MSAFMVRDRAWLGRVALGSFLVVAMSSLARADEAKPAMDSFTCGDRKIQIERFDAKKSGKVSAVIIVHGSNGLKEGPDDPYRTYARQLADAGYATFIVHYWDRTLTKTQPDEKLIRQYAQAWIQTIKDAVTYVSKQPNIDDKKIGLVGFSVGSILSLATVTQDTRIGAVVEHYGLLPQILAMGVKKMPPVLILHGEADKAISVDEAHKLEKLLKEKQLPYEIKLYPGQGHGFTGDDAKDATQRAIAFLDKNLK